MKATMKHEFTSVFFYFASSLLFCGLISPSVDLGLSGLPSDFSKKMASITKHPE